MPLAVEDAEDAGDAEHAEDAELEEAAGAVAEVEVVEGAALEVLPEVAARAGAVLVVHVSRART
jgi:hypothetical protein